jgi:hypothetical protein
MRGKGNERAPNPYFSFDKITDSLYHLFFVKQLVWTKRAVGTTKEYEA